MPRRVNQSTTAANIVTEVNKFFRHFVLQDKKCKKKQMSDLKLLELVKFDECPPQTNGHDCGLFAVAVVLHLVEGKEVNSQTFRQ
jgi:Ulp1 family protease